MWPTAEDPGLILPLGIVAFVVFFVWRVVAEKETFWPRMPKVKTPIEKEEERLRAEYEAEVLALLKQGVLKGSAEKMVSERWQTKSRIAAEKVQAEWKRQREANEEVEEELS